MGVVALGSVRSCGVTTLVLALAATWPKDRRVLLVEADPAGGTLAAASGWPPEPSLVSLAAAARRGYDPGLVWEHCQELPGGVAVLAGPASADQARNALGMLAGLSSHLGMLDADVLVDCGRLDPRALGFGVFEGADAVVLASRPRLADLHALATWREANPFDAGLVALVVVGDGPYSDAEIAEALGVEVLARLPWDPEAARALVSVPTSAREVRLSPLVRAARSMADRLASELAGAPPAVGSASDEVPAASTRSSRAGALRTRVLGAWRADPVPRSTNGSTPEEVSQ
ncbi:MAG: MinD/ParA family ATP-binding protein [Acidimicrobiales bacterium]